MDMVRSSRTIAGLVVVLAAVAILVSGFPGETWTWLVFAALFVLVDALGERQPGAGWIVGLAMATALDAVGAAIIVAFLATATACHARRRPRRLLAHVVVDTAPVLVLAAAVWLAPEPVPPVLGLLGGIAGAAARLATAMFDWTALSRTTHPAGHAPLALEVAESALLGAGAALVGAMVASVGGLVVPVAIAGVAVLVGAALAHRDVLRARVGTVRSLLTALEAKDLYTRGHAERVAHYARFTARHMGLPRRTVDRLELAALLHDIGKVAVPRHLLRKRGRLTPIEYCRVQYHAEVVPELLAPIRFLAPVIPIIAEHHLHFDGGGYGIESGGSLEAGILAVADAFDAMTSHRTYRAALSWEYAENELRRCSGTQFDPQVVDAFLAALAAMGRPSDAAGFESDEDARRRVELEPAHA